MGAIYDLRIYVAVTSPYLWNRGVTTIKESHFINGKYLEANVKALHALKSTLNDDYLSWVANFGSTSVVWNTLIFLGEQK